MVRKVLINGAFIVALGLLVGCGQGPVALAVIFGGMLSLLLGCGSVASGVTDAKFAKVVPIRFIPEPAVTPEPEPAPVALVEEEPAQEPEVVEAPRVRPRARVRRVQPAAMNNIAAQPELEPVNFYRYSRVGPSYWRDRQVVQNEKLP